MKKYTLTDEQLRNIKIFLQRTNLSGEEVSAFNQVTTALNQPTKDPAPEQVIKESPTDLLINELQDRDDWDMSDLEGEANVEGEPDVTEETDEIEEEPIIEKPKKTYKVKKSTLKKDKG